MQFNEEYHSSAATPEPPDIPTGKNTTSLELPPSILNPLDVHTQMHPFSSSSNRNLAPTLREFRHPADQLIWPFRTVEDLQQTSILIESELSAPRITKQLQFSYMLQGAEKRMTLTSAQDMYEVLDKGTIFEEGLISFIFSIRC